MEYEVRRAVERALHDRVQQQLVALGVKLQLAQQAAESDTGAVPALLDELLHDVHEALDDVRRLAWDVYPALLLDRGLVDALREGTQARVEADGVGRYPPDVEAAVYFSCVETLAGLPTGAAVRLADDGRELRFEIRSDGADRGPVASVVERVAAEGGRVTLDGDSLSAAIPLRRPARPDT